ncbi:type IV secretion system DNA-binding domain-containing protein [Crossiella sp. SN42]|uniref:type IV secretory system conjugative DNA transfer family protein n=1 Tax=Crossiella sp. SN42 TaxID=2944808 RepID=UPI00207D2AC0|nr:type IV secretion system DNA-binding domain-containing protein [Crossiella sp. SN42]MCO1575899.1 type IV secretion system DNA-binding domain-containing protein [Crossiella sp. SN42]
MPVNPNHTLPMATADVENSPLSEYLQDPAAVPQVMWNSLLTFLEQHGLLAGLLTSVTVTLVCGGRWVWQRRCHNRWSSQARWVTVLAPPQVDPSGGITLWANLIGLLSSRWTRRFRGQPHLAFEYCAEADGVRLRLWVPGTIPPGMVERAVEAAWPGAHTRTTPARHPLPSGAGVAEAGGQLRLHRAEGLPLRTEFTADPIRALLGAVVGLGPHEQACVQLLARPATGLRLARTRRAARRLHTRHGAAYPLARLLAALTPTAHRTRGDLTGRSGVDHQTRLAFSAQDRAVVSKQQGGQYETCLRYAVTTTLPPGATAELTAAAQALTRGRAHAVASAFAVYGAHNHYRRHRLRHPARTLAHRRLDRGDLLSVPELAALAHLPVDEDVPGIHRAGARAVPPPPGIPTTGAEVLPLGTSDAGHERPVGLLAADARQHLHILGATGSGKSELLAALVLADVQAGRGAVVIDGKGDLVGDLLARLPADCGDKLILFDPDAPGRPPVLNPLQGEDPTRVVDNLVSIFSRVYASSWGPRTEDILRASLLTLTAQPGTPTLTQLPKLLSVPAFRHRALAHVHDEVLRGFWAWFEELSPPARAQMCAPLLNKLRGFLLRRYVRDALAGGESTVDPDAVLDGGILLVRLAKDSLGVDTARLVGSLVIAHTWQAAQRRARQPQHQRRDASLTVDEFHNFLNLPYPPGDMLAEARGYRLGMRLAHQYLAQLPRELAEGVSANARNKIYFAASPEDARHLARHTAPRLGEHDLSNLGAFQIAARLIVHGGETPPFTTRTRKLPPPIPGRAKTLRAAARRNAERTTRPPTRDEQTPPRRRAIPNDPRQAA